MSIVLFRCFLSLSRSVRQLRSSLKDENLWKLLLKVYTYSAVSHICHSDQSFSIKLLAISNSELLCQSSAVVSNIILDFSPAKEVG